MVKKISSFALILTIFVAYKSLKEETKMKWISIATVLFVLVYVESTAQITIKTEYFGTSAYRDEHNQKVVVVQVPPWSIMEVPICPC